MKYNLPNETVITLSNVEGKFGIGVSSEVGYEAKRLGLSYILVITDPNISQNTKILQEIVGYLEEYGLKVDIFDKAHVEPVDYEVEKAIEYAKRKNYDGFIGVGGGSSIDTAKIVNLYTTYPTETFKDYIAPPTGKGKTVPGKLKPTIAIPTTAGSGSETSPTAVVDLKKEKIKVGISHQYLIPSIVLLDPLLTISLPPYYTAASGLDVLISNIEAYTTLPYNSRPRPESPNKRPVYIGANPISDINIEKSIQLIGKYLRRAYFNPYDIEARENMLLATHLGSVFKTVGVHIPHALAYAIAGRRPNLPHGVTVTLTAPAVLDFIEPVVPERLAKIASLLGEKTEGLSIMEAASLAKKALIKLLIDLNMPSGLVDLGIKEEDIPDLAKDGLKNQRLIVGCSRPVKEEDLINILKNSLHNW